MSKISMSNCLKSIRRQTWYYGLPEKIVICATIVCTVGLAAILMAGALTLHFFHGNYIGGLGWTTDQVLLRLALPFGIVVVGSLLATTVASLVLLRNKDVYANNALRHALHFDTTLFASKKK